MYIFCIAFSLKEQQANDAEKKPCFDISGTFYWCEPTRFEDILLVCLHDHELFSFYQFCEIFLGHLHEVSCVVQALLACIFLFFADKRRGYEDRILASHTCLCVQRKRRSTFGIETFGTFKQSKDLALSCCRKKIVWLKIFLNNPGFEQCITQDHGNILRFKRFATRKNFVSCVLCGCTLLGRGR